MFGWLKSKPAALPAPAVPVAVQPDPFPVRAIVPASSGVIVAGDPSFRSSWWDGEKYYNGWGSTEVLWPDYFTLRARSAELYRKNLYARTLLRRLVTNIVNTGLHLEATPIESVIGVPLDSLSEWSELVETRFGIWSDSARLCDHAERLTFGQLQALIKLEALVVGDVLVVTRIDEKTGLPRLQLISGSNVDTPLELSFKRSPRVRYGVELDDNGKHVAYYVRQENGTFTRMPAWGPATGRRMAWLVYGAEKRVDDVRGEPLLSLVMQSLKEIDRYRDAALRKAELGAFLAMYIRRDQPGISTMPLTGAYGAVRDEAVTVPDSTNTERSVRVSEHVPGLIIETLQPGEEPKAFPSTATDERFGAFEETMMAAVAAAYEVPPEIYRLAFSHNYSASQAANNEFALFLKRVRDDFARQVCQPCYEEWQLSELLRGKLDAPGLLEAWRTPERYDVYGAWIASDWAGQIKPAADMLKVVRAYEFMVNNGFMTRTRATRELSGMKYSTAMKQLRKDNEQLAHALEPLQANTVAMRPTPEEGAEQDAQDEQEDAAGKDEDSAQAGRTLALLPGRKLA